MLPGYDAWKLASPPEPAPDGHMPDQWYYQQAKKIWATDNLEIDEPEHEPTTHDLADMVSIGSGGAWVKAWVWVDDPEPPEPDPDAEYDRRRDREAEGDFEI